MADVLQFKRPPAKDPHRQGLARCIGCGHGWEAVAPAGTIALECPLCGSSKGRFLEVVGLPVGTRRWVCACENELFYVLERTMICANCGGEHQR